MRKNSFMSAGELSFSVLVLVILGLMFMSFIWN